jgi:hypothetical protein
MLVDEFVPGYDGSDSVVMLVGADLATIWDALIEVDLVDVGRRRPPAGVLGARRALPAVVGRLQHGEPPAAAPEHLMLRS